MSGKSDLQIPVLDGAVSMSESSCGNVSQTLVVMFNPKQANGSDWKLTLTFSPYGQGGFKLLNYTLDGSRPPNGTGMCIALSISMFLKIATDLGKGSSNSFEKTQPHLQKPSITRWRAMR